MNEKRRLAHEKNFQKRQAVIKGEGQYIFENNTRGDLILPHTTSAGRKLVEKGQQFIGDNYFFSMVRTGDLKLIREVTPPKVPQEQLLTEVPPTVTPVGPVEYHVKTKNAAKEVLLTESPLGEIAVIKN